VAPAAHWSPHRYPLVLGPSFSRFSCSSIYSLLQLLPFSLPLVWFILLLRPDSSRALTYAELHPENTPSEMGYAAIPAADVGEIEDSELPDLRPSSSSKGSLSLQDKWNIVSPLFLKYMLPLCKESRRQHSPILIVCSRCLLSKFIRGQDNEMLTHGQFEYIINQVNTRILSSLHRNL